MEANEGLAASNARRLFSEAQPTRVSSRSSISPGSRRILPTLFASSVRHPRSRCWLWSGAATLAVHDALVERAVTPGYPLTRPNLTPAMLERFRKTLETLGIKLVEAGQANVLEMDTLPSAWTNYDLIVTASMLEYLPRERLSEALAALGKRLNGGGRLVVFITRRNWLTRLLIGWWWESNLYHKDELLAEFERAGFSQVKFRPFSADRSIPCRMGLCCRGLGVVESRTRLRQNAVVRAQDLNGARNRDREE